MRMKMKTMLKLIFCIWSMLLFALWYTNTHAADAAFSWLPNSEVDLEGYKIHYGPESGVYDVTVDVGNPEAVNGRVRGVVTELSIGTTYYFAATAHNAIGDSPYSSEVVYTPHTESMQAPAEFSVTQNLNGVVRVVVKGDVTVVDGSSWITHP